MSQAEGFDAEVEGDLEKFLERVKEIWQSDKSRAKGALVRYGLTIGIRNKRAMLVPTVTTGKGMRILIIWNLKTQDITEIERFADGIKLPVKEIPYLWSEIPTVLPKEKPL
jgi:hypothetical protein